MNIDTLRRPVAVGDEVIQGCDVIRVRPFGPGLQFVAEENAWDGLSTKLRHFLSVGKRTHKANPRTERDGPMLPVLAIAAFPRTVAVDDA
eukprot:10519615-Alexandrium_andersonii.AAC.1